MTNRQPSNTSKKIGIIMTFCNRIIRKDLITTFSNLINYICNVIHISVICQYQPQSQHLLYNISQIYWVCSVQFRKYYKIMIITNYNNYVLILKRYIADELIFLDSTLCTYVFILYFFIKGILKLSLSLELVTSKKSI